MRRLLIAVPAIVLTMSMVALAQKAPEATPSKPAEDKAATDKSKALEELLAKALQNSPDVQVAEARLKEAEAALRQARLLVAQKTVDLQQNLDAKHRDLLRVESALKQATKIREAGQMSAGEYAKLETELAAQKAVIANIESQVNMIIGKLPGAVDNAIVRHGEPLLPAWGRLRAIGNLDLGSGGGAGDPPLKRQPQQAVADRLLKLLNSPYKAPEVSGQIKVAELFKHVRDASGAPILTRGFGDESVQIDFKGEVTLGAYFQILCDSVPNLQIFVRDYGFLVTNEGPPDDAISFMEFWHPSNIGG